MVRWQLSLGRQSLAILLIACAFASVIHAAELQRTAPDLENVAYGPHARNVLDLWKAPSDKPTPLIVFIHGGGFVNGDKGQIRNRPQVKQCLDAGVSFASINYRFREHAPIQDILRDAARAIQFIRSHAQDWNIDPARIAAYGGSAGAGTSMWLAFHEDLADPNAEDPVLRQSSRLTAAGSLNGQASYDLRDWAQVLGKSSFERPEADWVSFYHFKSADGARTAAADKIMRDCSMLNLVSKDDVPVALACTVPDGEPRDRNAYVHHPKHSIAIADRLKEQGIDCLLLLGDSTDERNGQATKVVAFLIEKLQAAAPAKR